MGVLDAVLWYGIWTPLVLWGAVEAARIRHWRWVATILLLSGYGAMAWFIAGRRWYRQPQQPPPGSPLVDRGGS